MTGEQSHSVTGTQKEESDLGSCSSSICAIHSFFALQFGTHDVLHVD